MYWIPKTCICFAVSSVFQTIIFLSQSISPARSVTQCLEPYTENGRLLRGKKNAYYVGDIVVFACDDVYTLFGSRIITCMPDGAWSSNPPYCKEIVCPQISQLFHGSQVGTVINFICLDGFFLLGQQQLTCSIDGSWYPNRNPYCKVAKCQNSPMIQNGNILLDAISEHFIRIKFTCDKGFTLKGPSSLTCTEKGKWTPDVMPYCEGSFTLGFTLKGPSSLTCTEEGKWTPDLMPYCEEVECPEILRLQNGAILSAKPTRQGYVNFTCDKGFTLKGPSSLTCTEEGKWTPDLMPYCEEVECPEILRLQNGAILSAKPTRQGYVNFTCDKGFTLKGPSSLTCTEEGKWTPDLMPYCEEVECPDILCLQNGAISSASLKRHGYVNFTCDKGFKMKGPSSLVCTDEGKWTPVMMPYCEEVKCPDILCINNGVMSSAKRHEYVNFTCDMGFTLKGPSSLACTEQGKWTPDVIPFCEENSKTDPHDIRQDHDTTTWVKFVASIVFVYSCSIGLVCFCVRKDWIIINLPRSFSCCKHKQSTDTTENPVNFYIVPTDE